MTKPCCRCGKEPRMVSSKGKTLTMCEGCQHEYWRSQKPKKYPNKVRKPKEEASPKPKNPRGRPFKYERLEHPIKVLVVNRRSGWIGRAEVEAKDFKRIQHCRDEASVARVMALFAADGYVVQEIGNDEPT